MPELDAQLATSHHIRPARVDDVAAISTLLHPLIEQEILLARSHDEILAQIPHFFVAERIGTDDNPIEPDHHPIIGCCALEVFTDTLGEVRSLVVSPSYSDHGLGSELVAAVETFARSLGLQQLMALTYRESFFNRLGYTTVSMSKLPEKVWRVCVKCPKFDRCDEIPVLKQL